MTAHDLVAPWLDSPDPLLRAHAAFRLAQPVRARSMPSGPTLDPSRPLEAAVLGCAWRGPPRGACSCHRCDALQGELGRVDPIVCLLCQRGRLRALPSP